MVLSGHPGKETKLALSNGGVLDDDTRAKRVKVTLENQLIDVPEGEGQGFYSIATYHLVEGGNATAADGVRNEAGRFANIFHKYLRHRNKTAKIIVILRKDMGVIQKKILF